MIRKNQTIKILTDEDKNKLAEENGFKLLRFWETDINNNPQQIIETLKKELNFTCIFLYINFKKFIIKRFYIIYSTFLI